MELSQTMHEAVLKCLPVTMLQLLIWSTSYVSISSTMLHSVETAIPTEITCATLQEKIRFTNLQYHLSCSSEPLRKTRFYEINTQNSTFHLFLEELNNDFLAPNFQIENRIGDLYVESSANISTNSCYYEGHVVEEPLSNVTLDVCGGLQGIIRRSTGEYLITPAKNNGTSVVVEHTIYKPDRLLQKSPHTSVNCGIQDHSKQRRIFHNYKLQFNSSGTLDAVLLRSRQRRAVSRKRYIETMVVADESMFEYYGRKEFELRRYLLSIMAIVTSIMKDHSIGNFIDVSVIKLVILKRNPSNLHITSDASLSLRRFCKWQKLENKPDDDDAEHFDAAILITRKNLCSSSEKCDTLGLAELGSVCEPIRSCAIVEDNGLSVAFTIAHEIGHLINAPHDGENNDCMEDTYGKVNIMTPTFSVNLNSWSWSPCSRKAITNFLESSSASCLLDKPSPKFEHPLPLKLPGELFSKDEQCQFVYGKRSLSCPFVNRCDRIWCIRSYDGRQSCHSNNMPWADGTRCGADKWCIHGHCHRKEKLKSVDGEWGKWGPYSKCSRSCGGGVKFASRECNHPKSAYGGNYCIGHRHKYKSCSIQRCRERNSRSKSFRAQQCEAFNGKNLGIPGVHATVTWKPKYTVEEEPCKLFCKISGYEIFYELAPKVIDGTKCRKNSNDICVDGECRRAGCDNVLDSNAKLDNCGVCNGDNSTCRTYYGYKNETHLGYNFVVHIPRGASQIEVVQKSINPGKHDSNFLALLDARRQYVFNGQWRVSLGKRRYTTYGTMVYYSGPNEVLEMIRVPGILRTAIEIRVLSIAASSNANIKYSYKFPVRGAQKYKWTLRSQWSECYPACQGHQVREFECQREIDSQVVALSKCTGTRPPAKYRMCNLDCTLRWDIFRDECIPINSCGAGIQQQDVVCKMTFTDPSEEDKILPNKDCHKAKIGKRPPKQIPCNAPCTRVRWFYTPWSKCNQTCGGGIQYRKALCVDQETNSTQPTSSCNRSPIGLLHRPCNTDPCPKWHTGAWAGVCSVTCGHGVVERIVSCLIAGKTVPDSQCNADIKPDKTRPCIMSACASWKVRAWSKCSESCGPGHQVREVYCETSAGEKVPDVECNPTYVPIDRRKCFEKACELKAKLTFNDPSFSNSLSNVRWLNGVWSECSGSCGGGFRERVVACVSDNVIVADTNCVATKKPVNKEICNVFSCPFWRHGAWSKCTKLCDKGSQTRLVLCGYNGTIVSDKWCISQSKPQERRYCNVQDCKPFGFSVSLLDSPQSSSNWKTGDWSKCSTTCGAGVRRRQVNCASGKCRPEVKPRDVITCNSGTCPGWNYGQWTPCYTKKGCGRGWQARLVVCQLDDGSILANTACDLRYKPVANRTCDMEPCKQYAKWTITPWQPCNVACGEGTQYRYISCEDSNGDELPDTRCLPIAPRPKQKKSCIRELCPEWVAGDWDFCDSTCHHRRVVECKRGSEILDNNLCKLNLKPVEEKECSNENCVKEPTYRWRIGTWSQCAATCGYSLRSRDIGCINDIGRMVKNSFCDSTVTMPKNVEQCFEGLCPPQWFSEPWTECSVTCGVGIKTRSVQCQGPNGDKLQYTSCALTKKPETKKDCSNGQCGAQYRWVTGVWAQCSRSCGIGEAKRDVYCYDEKNEMHEEANCITENRPSNMKVCNTHNCPFLSCRDIQVKLGVKFDGEQKIQVKNETLTVYCEGMHRSNPKEYITLKADPKENYAEIYGKRLSDASQCPQNGRRQIPCNDCVDYSASGVTFFKKVRLDIKRLAIVSEDKTFADRFGRNPPGFASAGDCYSAAKCPQGRFMVNLQGTSLRVPDDVKWTTRGYHTSQKIRNRKNGQVIYGKCGGYCGMCSPSFYNGLKVEIVKTSSR